MTPRLIMDTFHTVHCILWSTQTTLLSTHCTLFNIHCMVYCVKVSFCCVLTLEAQMSLHFVSSLFFPGVNCHHPVLYSEALCQVRAIY